MEAVGWVVPAAVLMRNLAMSRGLHAVDALLLVLRVQEIQNFELWERTRAAKRVPVQDRVREEEADCFGMSVTK